jgi:hypothetical protein
LREHARPRRHEQAGQQEKLLKHDVFLIGYNRANFISLWLALVDLSSKVVRGRF